VTAVSALATNDVWAVGSEVDFGIGVGESQPMAMHWDGTAWTALPAFPQQRRLALIPAQLATDGPEQLAPAIRALARAVVDAPAAGIGETTARRR